MSSRYKLSLQVERNPQVTGGDTGLVQSERNGLVWHSRNSITFNGTVDGDLCAAMLNEVL